MSKIKWPVTNNSVIFSLTTYSCSTIMKRGVIIPILLAHCFFVLSQSIPVDSIVEFYRSSDINCYKERINKGMQDFNRWLQDTLPSLTSFAPLYSPSDIDIRHHDAIHFVSLNFYNMSEYDGKDNIYNHIIIDSTRCVVLAPVDKKGKLLGITDIGECYSYISFTNKNDINYRIGYKSLKTFLKRSKKYNPDALVWFSTPYEKYKRGFVKNGRIYFLNPNPTDIDLFMRQELSAYSDAKHIKTLDLIHFPRYRESFNSIDSTIEKKTGNTSSHEIRLCSKQKNKE